MPWYLFNPIDSFPHDVCSVYNYTLVGNTPPNCGNPNIRLCAIQTTDNWDFPLITCALYCEIANALNTKVETTNVLLRPTLYP